ncbi:adhesion G protein-coupled receptor E4-like, partial [Otolemur garnettii]|uniref:adhesion G protein-coupled receptor E4-like n=1 Tax=Otolemur garnettii TaxID=30611 RepID=UPI000C7F4C61
MGSRCWLLLSGLGVLLTLSGSEAKNSRAFCPQCPEHAVCYNSTHCACEDGFQTRSGKRHFYSSYDRCEDTDECKTGLAKCKNIAYCRNKIGTYVCSCIVNYPLFRWVARWFESDQPDCYENSSGKIQPRANIWENLRDTGSKKDVASTATRLLQIVELSIWNESFVSPGKGGNSLFDIVYETRRCNETSEKALLEAGNNSMHIDCTRTFKGTTMGVSAVALITYQSLGDILNGSFFNNRRGLHEVKLNSHVVSGTIGLKDKVYLSEPIVLTFQHTQVGDVKTKHLCVYWKDSQEEGGSWSTEGCSHVYSNNSHTQCKCYHLSSFAVLIALTPKEDPVLTVITHVGLTMSVLCLFLAALTFLLCRPIQNTSTTLHLQLSLCLLLAHLLFLIGINRTEPQ